MYGPINRVQEFDYQRKSLFKESKIIYTRQERVEDWRKYRSVIQKPFNNKAYMIVYGSNKRVLGRFLNLMTVFVLMNNVQKWTTILIFNLRKGKENTYIKHNCTTAIFRFYFSQKNLLPYLRPQREVNGLFLFVLLCAKI